MLRCFMEAEKDPYKMLYRVFSKITNTNKFSNIETTFNSGKATIKHKFTQPSLLEFDIMDEKISVALSEGFGKEILEEIKKDIGYMIV
jgi:hypothetical protein